MESNANPMFKHINATLEEKVEIIATNPFRYYIAPNLWIGRNESRIDELNSLLKEAEENENFELCARIKEVTKKLRKILTKRELSILEGRLLSEPTPSTEKELEILIKESIKDAKKET